MVSSSIFKVFGMTRPGIEPRSPGPTPHEQDVTQGQFLNGIQLIWIHFFSFSQTGCHTKAKEPNLSYNLPIARRRIVRFITFSRVSALCEMQIASAMIWNRGIMAKVLDCGAEVSEFELQSRNYVHFRTNTFGKGMNPFILPSVGWIVSLLFFKDSFGIQ